MNLKFFFPVTLIVITAILPNCAGEKEAIRPSSLGAWVVYWDGERGLNELEAYGRLFDRVSLFAYDLGADGSPQPAPGVSAMLPRFFGLAGEKGFSAWVTLVNDWRTPNQVFLKETTQLRKLLSDSEKRQQHVRSIVDLVIRDGFSGLDLDYEGFSTQDREVMDPLIAELSRELSKKGLGFNVVVEPRADRYLPSPGVASIVVMGYNLHGPHNGPGPRATPAFIRSLSAKGRGDAQGKPTLTLAVGGFSWGRDRKVKQLDWETGNRQGASAAKKGRGKGEVPFAKFEDGSVIWFEDEKSLSAKWKAARKGFKALMLWRLGGNDDRLFSWLDRLEKQDPR
jgi:hypothetical protein